MVAIVGEELGWWRLLVRSWGGGEGRDYRK